MERFTNSLMMHGRNNGKKLMAVTIVKHAFEIIHLLTGEVWPKDSCCYCLYRFQGSYSFILHTFFFIFYSFFGGGGGGGGG